MNFRQRYWAFLAGVSVLCMAVAYIGHNANVFLFAGVLFGFDIWQLTNAGDK